VGQAKGVRFETPTAPETGKLTPYLIVPFSITYSRGRGRRGTDLTRSGKVVLPQFSHISRLWIVKDQKRA
jgi:hypothetical protein